MSAPGGMGGGGGVGGHMFYIGLYRENVKKNLFVREP